MTNRALTREILDKFKKECPEVRPGSLVKLRRDILQALAEVSSANVVAISVAPPSTRRKTMDGKTLVGSEEARAHLVTSAMEQFRETVGDTLFGEAIAELGSTLLTALHEMAVAKGEPCSGCTIWQENISSQHRKLTTTIYKAFFTSDRRALAALEAAVQEALFRTAAPTVEEEDDCPF
jgi:hypothetical protein